jgi:hypothetical protein
MINKDKTKSKLKFYPTEIFKEISLGDDDDKLQLRYAISNFGRLISFTRWDDLTYGRIIKGSKQDGYRIWRYQFVLDNKKVVYRHKFFYKLVAEYFLPKTSDAQVYVLHLNYKRADDHVNNLKWATRLEMLTHSRKSPHVILAKKKLQRRLVDLRVKRQREGNGNKLTSTQVMHLKKRLHDPNRKTRLKMLAKRFGVTTMTLQRIKTGENWGHIKV